MRASEGILCQFVVACNFVSYAVGSRGKMTMFFGALLAFVAFAVTTEGANLLGAPEDVAVEDAIINEVAHFAVENHPGDTLEDGYFDALQRIVSAEHQVGTLYNRYWTKNQLCCLSLFDYISYIVIHV